MKATILNTDKPIKTRDSAMRVGILFCKLIKFELKIKIKALGLGKEKPY